MDPNIKDANGYNAELGYKRQLEFSSMGYYRLLDCSIITVSELYRKQMTMELVLYRTEQISEIQLPKELKFLCREIGCWAIKSSLSVFTSTAFMDARYTGRYCEIREPNIAIDGNQVESAPNLY